MLVSLLTLDSIKADDSICLEQEPSQVRHKKKYDIDLIPFGPNGEPPKLPQPEKGIDNTTRDELLLICKRYMLSMAGQYFSLTS